MPVRIVTMTTGTPAAEIEKYIPIVGRYKYQSPLAYQLIRAVG